MTEYTTPQSDPYPQLVIVSQSDYQDPAYLPRPDRVREAIQEEIIPVCGWLHDESIVDIRAESVAIQHEAPPEDPYDAVGIVIYLRQIPTDMRTVDQINTDPITELIDGLYAVFDPYEVTVDGETIETNPEIWLSAGHL